MDNIKHFGPVRAEIDNESQSVVLQLRRSGPEAMQLLDGEIENMVTWLVTVLETKGYSVDITGVVGFDDW